VRRWRVAGGLLADRRGLLLVANRRRNGSVDWSTPGGVIDPGEAPLEALGREVAEETGLVVEGWVQLCWTVSVDFADLDMNLHVEVHRAKVFSGELAVDDPDGIVTAAEFLELGDALQRLGSAPRWVAEPISDWLHEPWSIQRRYRFAAHGKSPYELSVERLDDQSAGLGGEPSRSHDTPESVIGDPDP